MGIAQLSKQLGKNLEHELTFIFATMGDSYLPEAAHTCSNDHENLAHTQSTPQHRNTGMDGSGLATKPAPH